MSDDLEVDEAAIKNYERWHATTVDRHNEVPLPPEGDWGWVMGELTTIAARGASLNAAAITANGGLAHALDQAWERFRHEDDEAAALFNQLGEP
ncbi:hypothetical protein ACPYO6_01390 [Georgenia sp. Z1344]|uniref:hypothetical protein n=1 Tax=Georgenia sp. Z1344 TaxID=3416706 RepID=UPI003CF23C06